MKTFREDLLWERPANSLTKIIQSIQSQGEEVYIANIVKCRPPQNRNPEPDEIQTCRPFLLKQIQAIQPKIICALGTFAAQSLLKTGEKITVLRGKCFDLEGIKVIPTYHPAFLLRNPERKREVWEDMKQIADWLKGVWNVIRFNPEGTNKPIIQFKPLFIQTSMTAEAISFIKSSQREILLFG